MNRKPSLVTFLLAALLLNLCACAPGKPKQPDKKSPFHPGTVIPRVACLQDTTVSYALFLPENYDPSSRYPLIIAFDSHAAGKLPVDLFSAQAGHYGYIIAGSNNSKNGVAWDITSAQFEAMRRDILQRLSIDTSRIYTAGFSGGSRVAASVAIYLGGVAGVIGCSAGFPQLDRPLTSKFSYLGVVGNADFNFTEMKALDKALAGAGFIHQLLIFDGIHAWPPISLIPSIFTWLELDAMRQNLKPADEGFIGLVREKYQHRVDSLHRRNDLMSEYLTCLEAQQMLNGTTDVRSFTKKAAQLSRTPTLEKQVREDDLLAQKEIRLQQYYAGALDTQNEIWWRGEVNRLEASAAKSSTKSERNMYKRILSYLSLAAYMKSTGSLQAGDQEHAGSYIRIYALVDPANAEAPYLEAGWLARQGKEEEALKRLARALELGFSDLSRIKNDPAFSVFKGKADFQSILERLKVKK